MSMLLKELKAEIARLARKTTKQGVAPIRRVTAAQRGLIADLRRQVTGLQKEIAGLRKAMPAATLTAPPVPGTEKRFWITGKGVRALRKRLGLTQAELGRLAGVSSQSVVKWEGTSGKAGLRRKAARTALQRLRTLNKRSARELLEAAAPKRPRKTSHKRSRKSK